MPWRRERLPTPVFWPGQFHQLRSMGCKEWDMTEWLSLGVKGFPGGPGGKAPTCQCRRSNRCRFDPWVGEIPWRRAWKSTPVVLAWRIPPTEEPGALQSTGSQSVRHEGDWALASEHKKQACPPFPILSVLQLSPSAPLAYFCIQLQRGRRQEHHQCLLPIMFQMTNLNSS